MMTETAFKRGQILAAILDRLSAIQKVNGYQTDAGLSVHLGRVDESVFSQDIVGGIVAIEPGEEVPLAQGGAGSEVLWSLPAKFIGVIAADLEDPLEPAENLLGDMDRAVFGQPDRTLGGLLDEEEGMAYGPGPRVTHREPGSQVVSAEFEAIYRYAVAVGAAEAVA